MEKTIGQISNYYGCLSIKEENQKYFWGIEDWDGCFWEEIPEALYDALVDFENKRNPIT